MDKMYIPVLTRRAMAEDFAIHIRDQVNTAFPDRLSIVKFTDAETEIEVQFDDSLFPEGEQLNVVWQPGMDYAPVVEVVLNARPDEAKEEEINTTHF